MTFLVNKRTSFKYSLQERGVKNLKSSASDPYFWVTVEMKENEPEWREIKKILAERFFQNLVKNGRIFILVILSVMYLHIFFFFLVKK